MKLNLFFASNSEKDSPKKSLIKKLVSTAITTIVMGMATLFFTSYNEKSLLQMNVPDGGEEATAEATHEAAPRGLTRQRLDFDKALNILAQGAENDSHLADYYSRVQKRVQGEAAKHENGSGVRAVKVSRKINQPSDQQSQAGDSPAVNRAQAQAGLKGFAESAMVADSQTAPTSDSSAQVVTLSAPATANVSQDTSIKSSLTIGDMVYSTNPAIERWVNWYTVTPGGRRTMTIGIQRSNAYVKMARAEFRRA
ncbi:MAG TPA: hypothetical protein VE732_01185, partial [Nitrososphaera sp.]|nr:hypothetical protein [Nitrososphaera sp.]